MKQFFLPLLLVCFSVSATAAYKDGVYSSEAMGHVGPVKVEVTVKEGKVSNVKVVKHNDTIPLVEAAEKKVGDAVLNNQSAENLPRVTGASMSGGAIATAVKEALSNATVK